MAIAPMAITRAKIGRQHDPEHSDPADECQHSNEEEKARAIDK